MKAITILDRFAKSGKLTFEEFRECMDAITELEDFENKSCDGCVHHLSANGNIPLSCCECSRFYADNYYEVEK